MKLYAYLYHAYNLFVSIMLRAIIFIASVTFIIEDIHNHIFPKLPLFILSIFLMGEVVYWFKFKKTIPKLNIDKNTGDLEDSCTLQAIDSLIFSKSGFKMAQSLAKKKDIQFLLLKSNIVKAEIPENNISKEEILKQAAELVKELGGQFITTLDLCAAYLLLAEPEAKLLFAKHIKQEEFIHLLYWARVEYPQEEQPLSARVRFWGEGVFDTLATGWTPETKNYIVDLTYNVLNRKPVLLGRKEEFHNLIAALSKPERNNALLIGDVGVGKTSVIEALTLNSYLGLLPGRLYHQRVYELMVNLLIGGIQDIGQLTARLEAIMNEISHAGNVILYIPNLENILGSSTFNTDLSGALIPYLKEGKIPFIATVTTSAYKIYFEKSKVLADLFENIVLEEPNKDEAIQMVLERANDIERQNGVTFTFKAVISAVDFAQRFMQDKALPGSAVELLASVASFVKSEGRNIVSEEDIVAKIEQITHGSLAAPGEAEKNLLLNLESELHKRIIGQEDAVSAIAQAIRRVRSGVEEQTRPISFLFLGPTGVGKTETAKALATLYFGGENKIARLDMSEYTGLDAVNRLLGEFTDKIYDHPFSLVLLDEFEKAHPEVLDLFLQVLDDGRLTDNHGKKVSFANTIIIATSNAGALFIQDQGKKEDKFDSAFQEKLIEDLENEHIFKPELLNRFDGIVVFKPLTQEQIFKIAQLYLKRVEEEAIKQKDITLKFDQSIIDAAARLGFDPKFGARPLRRYIEKIEDMIAQHILDGKIQRGNVASVSIDSSENIVVEPAS